MSEKSLLKKQELKQRVHDELLSLAPYVAEKILNCSLRTDKMFDLQNPACCVVGWIHNTTLTRPKDNTVRSDEITNYLGCETCDDISMDLAELQEDYGNGKNTEHIDSIHNINTDPTTPFLKLTLKLCKHVKKEHTGLIKSDKYIKQMVDRYNKYNKVK